MSKRLELLPRQIPIEILDMLAVNCTEIGGRFYVHGQELYKLGFRLFEVLFEDELKDCNEEQQGEHRAIAMEMAKEIVGACGPITAPLHSHGRGYVSPLLESLRTERGLRGYDDNFFRTAGSYGDMISIHLKLSLSWSLPATNVGVSYIIRRKVPAPRHHRMPKP